MKKLLAVIIFATAFPMNASEILQNYTFAQNKEGKSVIVLTTNYGPGLLAKMHGDAIRYFLDYASIHGAELYVEGMGAVSKDSKRYDKNELPITESLILLAKKTKRFNKLYVSTPDCRTDQYAKVLMSFFPIVRLLEMSGLNTVSADLYQELQTVLATNNSAITIEDYLDHLKELRQVIEGKKRILGSELVNTFIENYDLMANALTKLLRSYTKDFGLLVSTLGLKMLKEKASLKEFQKIIALFTAPSTRAAQVCFLSAIKESEETMDPTIVVLTYPIAMRVLPYLAKVGFKTVLETEITSKTGALDLWGLIDLLYQSLGDVKRIEKQQAFLSQLKSKRQK